MSNIVYVQGAQLRSHFPEWERWADKTAGQVYDQDSHKFWELIRTIVIGGEGNIDYLYRDTGSHVTTGFGYLICMCNSSTGAIRDTAAAERAITSYEWKADENSSTILTRHQVIQQLHEFVDKTRHFAPNWNRLASSYRGFVNMRMRDPNAAFVYKATREIVTQGRSRWDNLKAKMPNWHSQPFYVVAAAFRLIWFGNDVGGTVAREKASQKHYRDYEEAAAKWYVAMGPGIHMQSETIFYLRDLVRAGAKYFCPSDCNGACSLSSDCRYKHTHPTHPPQQDPKPKPPPARHEPRQTPPPSHWLSDIYRIELKAWDPFVRSVGYGGADYVKYSVAGDNHVSWGDPDTTTYRVFVTARFKYYYEIKNGKHIGHYIGPADLDPKPHSQLRTAAAQTKPIYGDVHRYKLEGAGHGWVADHERLPRHRADGTRVTWGQRQQNFESFTIEVNAEDVTAPHVAPPIRATLRCWFEGPLLKLTLDAAKYPNIGVRVERRKHNSNSVEDLLPNYHSAIVNAHHEYLEYLKRRGHDSIGAAHPADPKKPGPPQMHSQAFRDQAAHTMMHWAHNIDWTKGPPAPKHQPAHHDPAPAPTPHGGHTETGYQYGRPFPIEVVTVQGFNVEIHTAAEFNKMHEAAHRDGVPLTIVSGFRTMAKQQELYNLYLSGRGNLAAKPGYSNHQSGHALDLAVHQTSAVYRWLASHGSRFNFRRTVQTEDWHWEWWPSWSGRRWVDPYTSQYKYG